MEIENRDNAKQKLRYFLNSNGRDSIPFIITHFKSNLQTEMAHGIWNSGNIFILKFS
jgi:hypothetical protein